MAFDFTDMILEYAGAAGASLSRAQADLCRMHVELMLEWNRRLNLTRITRPDEIVVKHLLDSITPASRLPASGLALDVGTGAGFPGIPLKICHPELEFTLLDSSRKKVSFLAVAAARLRLMGTHPLHGRWEELSSAPENQNRFQLITMRAVRLELPHLSKLAAGMLKVGGTFAWWAGPESEESFGEIPGKEISGMAHQERIVYTLPGISRQRSVWIWKKTAAQD